MSVKMCKLCPMYLHLYICILCKVLFYVFVYFICRTPFKNRDIKESSFSLSALTTRLYDTWTTSEELYDCTDSHDNLEFCIQQAVFKY